MSNPQPQNELSYFCRTPDFLERLGDPWYVLLAQLQSTINSDEGVEGLIAEARLDPTRNTAVRITALINT